MALLHPRFTPSADESALVCHVMPEALVTRRREALQIPPGDSRGRVPRLGEDGPWGGCGLAGLFTPAGVELVKLHSVFQLGAKSHCKIFSPCWLCV